MDSDARTLIAQHAKTAQLMGVDFLPLGSAANVQVSIDSPSVSADDQLRPAPSRTPEPVHSPAAPSFNSPSQPEFKASASDIKPINADSIRSAYEQLDTQQAKLDAIGAKYELESPHQHLNTSFTNIVFGEGDPNADLMFIGEAPDEQDDQTGRPFVGRAGQTPRKHDQSDGALARIRLHHQCPQGASANQCDPDAQRDSTLKPIPL